MTEVLAANPLAHATGLALLQFLWQGAFIGACTAILLIALQRSTAQARYVAGCLGLALMLAAPIVTAGGYVREKPAAAAVGAVSLPASAVTPHRATPPGERPMSAADIRVAGRFGERIERWLPLVVLTWSAGVLVLALHLLRGWIRLRRIRRGATLLGGDRWPATVRRIAVRIGVTRSVQLAESALVEVPAVIGWLRPMILVPASALAGLSPADLDAILAHELAHVRRGDYLVNVLQCVIEVLLFYHPVVWWVSGRIRQEREHCCDDIAAACSPDRVTYARALASLEELRGEAPRLAMAAGGADLLHRIRRLVEPGSPARSRWSGGFMMGVVVTVVLCVAGGVFESQMSGPTVSVADLLAANPAITVTASPPPRSAPRPVAGARTELRQQSVPTAPPRDPVARGVGQILGEVRDTSGGALPGVTVTVASVATAVARTAVTNQSGQFHLEDLAAGAYELTATLPSFRAFKAKVQIAPNEDVSAGIRLQFGARSETVTVIVPRPASAPPPRDPIAPVTPDADALRGAATEDRITPIPPKNPREPIRVGGDIREPKKIRNVDPIYPPDAAAANVTGFVIVEAVIGTDGAVKDARVLKGHPLLDDAALGAVRKWVYRPMELNGVPIELTMTATIIFSMR